MARYKSDSLAWADAHPMHVHDESPVFLALIVGDVTYNDLLDGTVSTVPHDIDDDDYFVDAVATRPRPSEWS